eukprot:TRINITY_DN3766_c0_g1_i1.p1 TRINITY_DN3766_c0_g1~~TRINITY_DN3766_c0_g1_i1.p1  ORF type:complete len:469 (+),score=116.21 TRINITY_DN3766_c0_g1_i1:105-1511(+)
MSFPELLGGFTINLAFISNGFSLGFPTVALSQLKADGGNGSAFHLTPDEGSWVAGILGIGGVCGSVVLGTLVGQCIGNRKTLILSAVIDILGWLLITFSVNAVMMIIGRFLNGIFVGTIGPAGYTLISEIMHKNNRGSCSQATSVSISIGMLVTYGAGALISWNYLALGCAIPTIVFLVMLLLMPDSPYYNVSTGRIEEAKKSLSHFRSKDHDVEAEFKEILEGIQKYKAGEKLSFMEAMKALFKDETCYKPFAILNFLFVLQTLSGLYAVISYAVQVLENSGTPIDKYLGAVISGGLRLVFAGLAIPGFLFFPRKVLMYISTGTAAVSISALGAMGLMNLETSVFTQYFPIVAISVYMVAFTIGFQSIPFLYLGEYYPPHVRQHLAGLTSTFRFLGFFIMLKCFPKMMESLGPHLTFLFLGFICLISGLYSKFILPETKGLTLNQIQDLFRSSPTNKSTDESTVSKL